MLVIGEKLNSSIPKTLDAIDRHDEAYLLGLIKLQADSGADYLDINTALGQGSELENMQWLAALVREHSPCGIMLDSPDPEVLLQCIPRFADRRVMVNSITLSAKYDALIGVIRQYHAGVVCLPIGDKSLPSPDERLTNAQAIAGKLLSAGIPSDKIYIDVLVEAIATGEHGALSALSTIKLIKDRTGVNTLCGLSNVSFGLPDRARLNSAFLSMAMLSGLDSAIMDITSPSMKSALAASNALLGNDEYCLDYIRHARSSMGA